jgi:hypothetical protein
MAQYPTPSQSLKELIVLGEGYHEGLPLRLLRLDVGCLPPCVEGILRKDE